MTAPRVIGLETEYGVVTTHLHPVPLGTPPPLDSEATARLIFRFRPEGYRHENMFLPNGGRLYLDIGSHPEYASAECSTVAEAVAQDRAGEELLRAMMTKAEAELAATGNPGVIHLLKNNSDSQGNTYGCHENYSVPRQWQSEQALPGFFSFLVTRQILVGSGCIHREESGRVGFGFSPRAEHLVAQTSADPTKERALINTRDEPHADPGRFRRLHVICGDSNISTPSTALKVGLTCVFLDMIEAGVTLSDLALQDPIAALHAVSNEGTGLTLLQLENGKTMTAVEVQEEFLCRMLNHLQRSGPSPALSGLHDYVLDLAARGLEALRSGNHSQIDTELDWAIKRKLLTQVCNRRGCDLSSGEIVRAQLAYHDMSTTHGLAPKLRQAGAMRDVVSAAAVEAATQQAPSTTRATIRGRFITAALARQVDFAVSWDKIRLDSPPSPEVDMPDPFELNNEAADALVTKIYGLAEHETKWIDYHLEDGRGIP